MADDDIIRGGLDIVTDKTKQRKPKAVLEPHPPSAARLKKINRRQSQKPEEVRKEKRTKANMIPVIRIYALHLETVLSRPTETGVTI